MLLLDVNILVYAHREDASDHQGYLHWLEELVDGSDPFALSELVLSGFIRIVTHPKVFATPSPLRAALDFVDELRSQPNCVVVSPGPRHWEIFTRLCEDAGAKGNLVPDAYLAALAIESGSEWATADRGFARFPGLRWLHPFR